MAAAKAQAALASEAFKPEPNGWLKPITADNAAEVAHEWLARNKARQDTLLHGFRQINDDLAACFFTAAEDLAEGLKFKSSESAASAAKPAGSKAAAPSGKAAVAA